jgi:hypothetical protein
MIPLYFGKDAAGRRTCRVPSRIVWIRQVSAQGLEPTLCQARQVFRFSRVAELFSPRGCAQQRTVDIDIEDK